MIDMNFIITNNLHIKSAMQFLILYIRFFLISYFITDLEILTRQLRINVQLHLTFNL